MDNAPFYAVALFMALPLILAGVVVLVMEISVWLTK